MLICFNQFIFLLQIEPSSGTFFLRRANSTNVSSMKQSAFFPNRNYSSIADLFSFQKNLIFISLICSLKCFFLFIYYVSFISIISFIQKYLRRTLKHSSLFLCFFQIFFSKKQHFYFISIRKNFFTDFFVSSEEMCPSVSSSIYPENMRSSENGKECTTPPVARATARASRHVTSRKSRASDWGTTRDSDTRGFRGLSNNGLSLLLERAPRESYVGCTSTGTAPLRSQKLAPNVDPAVDPNLPSGRREPWTSSPSFPAHKSISQERKSLRKKNILKKEKKEFTTFIL